MKRIILTILILLTIQASLLVIGFITITSQYIPNLESSYMVQIIETNKHGDRYLTDSWLVRYQEQEPVLAMVISY